MNSHPYLHNPHLNGAPFYCEQDGQTAVLLLHGLTATPLEVRALAERLYAAGYTVDGPLLPGHGTRPADLNRVRWQDWAALAQDRYDFLAARFARVFVGGESTGAVLALWLAAHNPNAAGVLAYAPAVRLALSPVQIALLYLAMPWGLQVRKRGLERDTAWQGYKVHTARGVIELVRLQRAVRRRLKAIQQPVLVVQGRRDRTIHPASAEMVVRGVSSRRTELHWMPASGHCVLLDCEFEAVARLTIQFIKQVVQST